MRAAALALIAIGFLALLPFAPYPLSPTRSAGAWHVGAVECTPAGDPLPDGVIAAGEYGENYFDGVTKILAYVSCDNSTARILHVGLVTPWAGWVGLLVQADDSADGTFNEVRVSYAGLAAAPRALDAYRSATGSSIPDVTLGGSDDVGEVSTGTREEARVFEFSVSLASTDAYDSHLTSTGPYLFALAYNATDADLSSQPTETSEVQSFLIGGANPAGSWTTVELVVPASSIPLENASLLVALRDASGYPVPSAQIEIFVKTAFGFFDLGPVVAGEGGVAEVTYTPRDAGTFLIGAAYTGGYGRLASVAWHVLNVGETPPGTQVGLGPFEGGTFELRTTETLIVVVVLGVWATYAYASFVTWIALREPKPRAASRDARVLSWRPGR